jgi:hypothetical protein
MGYFFLDQLASKKLSAKQHYLYAEPGIPRPVCYVVEPGDSGRVIISPNDSGLASIDQNQVRMGYRDGRTVLECMLLGLRAGNVMVEARHAQSRALEGCTQLVIGGAGNAKGGSSSAQSHLRPGEMDQILLEASDFGVHHDQDIRDMTVLSPVKPGASGEAVAGEIKSAALRSGRKIQVLRLAAHGNVGFLLLGKSLSNGWTDEFKALKQFFTPRSWIELHGCGCASVGRISRKEWKGAWVPEGPGYEFLRRLASATGLRVLGSPDVQFGPHAHAFFNGRVAVVTPTGAAWLIEGDLLAAPGKKFDLFSQTDNPDPVF